MQSPYYCCQGYWLVTVNDEAGWLGVVWYGAVRCEDVEGGAKDDMMRRRSEDVEGGAKGRVYNLDILRLDENRLD